MKLLILNRAYRLRKWYLRKPQEQKWFAWYPVFVEGHYRWLEWVYRFRVIGYRMNYGEERDYLYELEPHVRNKWVKGYIKTVQDELKKIITVGHH